MGEGKSTGLEIGIEIKGGKKRKKENLGKIQLLTLPNQKNWLVKHNLTLSNLWLHCFNGSWGRKL